MVQKRLKSEDDEDEQRDSSTIQSTNKRSPNRDGEGALEAEVKDTEVAVENKRRRTARNRREAANDDDGDEDMDVSEHNEEAPQAVEEPTASPERKVVPRSPLRSINAAGKPAEAGVILKVHVENFMCHRKLTINLCKNVNFIHGQNGSGKSAILAAIQICLGAGAKRTHRARNLKDLVRKEGGNTAKVRVTLLNKGPDAFEHDKYGDQISIERSISLTGTGGYKLLDHKLVARSNRKKDLDTLLDQLNIQVENPVAVLDQEEAKKFLTGKAEDKYAFFSKATELERLDRQYANIYDQLQELGDSKEKVENSLVPKKEIVVKLKKEWEQFEILDKMEQKLGIQRCKYAWSLYEEMLANELEQKEELVKVEEKIQKRKDDLAKAESSANTESNEEEELVKKIEQFTSEADEATQSLMAQQEDLKAARLPLKQQERVFVTLSKDKKVAQQAKDAAVKALDTVRAEIRLKAGSAESEEVKRTEAKIKAEERMDILKKQIEDNQQAINDACKKYQEKETPVENAKDNVDAVKRQFLAVSNKLQGLRAGDGNSKAVFGNKCVSMFERVEQAKRERCFQGPVFGPIGDYLKIVDGKEHLSSLVTSAVSIGLDRFIVTNDRDRSYFMRLRQELRCNARECLVIQTNAGARYNSENFKPPEGVDTALTVLSISNDLVFNVLVDSAKIDTIALMNSREESEQKLLISENNRASIRGGVIKEVHFLPQGDNWRLFNGSKSMTSNTKPLRQVIGVDRTTSIRETENEKQSLEVELRELTSKHQNLSNERHQYKVQWNNLKKADKEMRLEIQDLEETISQIQLESEAAENVTIDTKEYEDDVQRADRAVEQLKEKLVEAKIAVEELKKPIADIAAKVDETKARSEKVDKDLSDVSERYQEYMRTKEQRDQILEKKRSKLAMYETYREGVIAKVDERAAKTAEAKFKAQRATYQHQKTQDKKLSDEDDVQSNDEAEQTEEEIKAMIEAIEPVDTGNKGPQYFRSKIERGEKEIKKERERRQISEVDPEVALMKYQRAKKDLEEKLIQIQMIDTNYETLVHDLKERKKRWKEFRGHISKMSNNTFDIILNKKGSSGFIEFDHRKQSLNLVVQKDNRDENTQTNDVKALSGGERSFTTLSLLLALGESLETPFRVMDEFDVFLDPVARKIALKTMISLAKEMEHRQFIFITPQDLSNIPTDPQLKIFHLKPPKRSDVVGEAAQQTLQFEALQ